LCSQESTTVLCPEPDKPILQLPTIATYFSTILLCLKSTNQMCFNSNNVCLYKAYMNFRCTVTVTSTIKPFRFFLSMVLPVDLRLICWFRNCIDHQILHSNVDVLVRRSRCLDHQLIRKVIKMKLHSHNIEQDLFSLSRSWEILITVNLYCSDPTTAYGLE
jgi:hypothetical protein